jgi:hypothetical protein
MQPRATEGCPRTEGWARALATAAALAAVVVFGLAWTWRPEPVGLEAAASEFSAVRARAHLEAIARRPHRIGSPEHARVRAYIVEQLTSLGLTPEIDATLVFRTEARPPRFAIVRNIVARRPGTGTGKALLLMSHYDSRGITPGASDDGYGVATLLETARALGREPLASDVVFLFTDGEEEGLLGAKAFVAEHPFSRDIGAVLNVEARGNTGPVLMFQTGDDNGALIRELGRAAPHAAANSISQAVYRRMPNDTDLSVFLPNAAALNFANIGGLQRYHAPTDTLENADLGTLQHHGSYILPLTRALAGRTLPVPKEADATYFDVGPFFVHYPSAYDLPFALVAAALVAAFVVVGHRRGALRAGFVALAVLVTMLVVFAAGVGAALAWRLATRLGGDSSLFDAAKPLVKHLFLATFVAFGAWVSLAIQARWAKRIRATELFAGSSVLGATMGVLAAAWLPGAAFSWTWPVLASMPFAIGAAIAGVFDRDTPIGILAGVASSAGPLIIVAPFIPQLFAAFGPFSAPAVAGLSALLATTSAPAVRHLLAPAPRPTAAAALALAAAAFVAANLIAPFDRDYPRPETVVFAVDADTKRSFWITPDRSPPSWARETFAGATRAPAPLPYPLGDVFAAPAPAVDEPAPEIVWLDPQGAEEGSRRVRVVPPGGTEELAILVEGVHRGRVSGVSVPVEAGSLSVRFYAPPIAGVELVLLGDPGSIITVRAASHYRGVPAGMSAGVRPAESMPRAGRRPPPNDLLESDTILVATASAR